MKSLLNPIIHAAGGNHQPWSPPELLVEAEQVVVDEKKEKILALFGLQELQGPEKKEKRTSLHSAESSQQFINCTNPGHGATLQH